MSLRPPPRRLAELLESIDAPAVPPAAAQTEIEDVTLDSRAVQPGALFLACRGRTRHGLKFLAEALGRGARAVLWEPAAEVPPPVLPADVPGVAVPGLGRQAGMLADRFFDSPSRSLWIAGITGTNGKTTVAWLVAQALEACGRRTGYLGTLGTGFVEALRPAEYTTSDPVSVHRSLATLRDAGASSVAMEVSSHALDQDRVAGVRFRCAAFTNLSRDHLDYHGTMAAYGAAKAKLFDWPGLGTRVLNADDPFGASLAQRVDAPGRVIVTGRAQSSAALQARLAALGAGWVRADGVELDGSGQRLRITSHLGRRELHAALVGEFNADNLLTALAILLAYELPLDRAARALERARAPRGRMEILGGEDRPLAIVDYAHSPDALAKALRAARAHVRGRLIVVFGCGGERDAGKRPLMAAVAAELADEIVITDDNPRRESPARIVADILAGLPAGRSARVIHDRVTAIETALGMARPGDIVLVAGKGHEDYQIIGEERRPFSDQAVLRAVLGRSTGATP